MINHLMNNATFSTAINQANNKNTSQVNAKNETIDDKQKTKENVKTSESKVDTIKDAIKNGTYKIDLRGSAEKLAQELLR
ncbi:flagellar biosynthesis anti-sigma factor FlgM [Helicobacter sp. MIT 11-5569]|uniref:flagellar biosynthesis anti-sigma factor FlgM n=1 Tax=Helicobacter sp. MIT 11-5569 TaxID=1548151 RepID=UPI00051FAE42|nr:flagellar biosynthesis anti-sigma factor FlgM [Helicobacter sp. MIT 11-5569]TLD84041.1 flagellar biosynthesis anti-sigma factor FlgM [Helicobacter sp. MIT 11-5569]